MKRRTRFDPNVVIQIASLMRRERVDVVHTLNFTANAWGRAAAKIAGVPRIIAHERGTAWTETPDMCIVDCLLYKITDLVLANSEAARIMLIDRINLPEDRIRVVHNGLPLPEPTERSKTLRGLLRVDAHTPLVGAVGRMDTPKGHIFLLEAIPLVWDQVPDVHFTLIGDGPLRTHLEIKANRLGLTNAGKFHLPGYLLDAPTLLREMDLLVHPSFRESLTNVLIEAGYAGLPTIASNVDGCSEIVSDGETGIRSNAPNR